MHVIQASCPLPFCTYIDKNDNTDKEICVWFSLTYSSYSSYILLIEITFHIRHHHETFYWSPSSTTCISFSPLFIPHNCESSISSKTNRLLHPVISFTLGNMISKNREADKKKRMGKYTQIKVSTISFDAGIPSHFSILASSHNICSFVVFPIYRSDIQ